MFVLYIISFQRAYFVSELPKYLLLREHLRSLSERDLAVYIPRVFKRKGVVDSKRKERSSGCYKIKPERRLI